MGPDSPDIRSLHAFAGEAAELDAIPVVTHWPSVPAADAETEWKDLHDWVSSLRRRFDHLDHHVIPACWWLHNEHVEALAALRDHERLSFADNAPATAPVDWFKALRDIGTLLRAWTSELACGATHRDPSPGPDVVDTAGWEAYVAADVERRHQAAIACAGD
ncbi:MAG: hypothetical protein M0Z30_15955 [Actinomycetota bacterium]|nr:hypothetical protein [Actinomycetota bacterium]